MAGLQTIIDNCNGLTFDRRNVVGIQYTRNEIPRVSQTPTKNPWKIKVEMPNSFRYSQARAVIEALDHLDRTTPEVITFANNPNLSWIYAYQGSMSLAQRNALTIDSYVGNMLTLTNLPVLSATRVLFEPNDLIQISGSPYPFTVRNQVLRGSNSTITLETSRPNIISHSVVGYNIIVGNACQFNVFCPNMPVYKLSPGGQLMTGNTVINNALIEWSDSFKLYEWVGAA
jgi:hypothetical protein